MDASLFYQRFMLIRSCVLIYMIAAERRRGFPSTEANERHSPSRTVSLYTLPTTAVVRKMAQLSISVAFVCILLCTAPADANRKCISGWKRTALKLGSGAVVGTGLYSITPVLGL